MFPEDRSPQPYVHYIGFEEHLPFRIDISALTKFMERLKFPSAFCESWAVVVWHKDRFPDSFSTLGGYLSRIVVPSDAEHWCHPVITIVTGGTNASSFVNHVFLHELGHAYYDFIKGEQDELRNWFTLI